MYSSSFTTLKDKLRGENVLKIGKQQLEPLTSWSLVKVASNQIRHCMDMLINQKYKLVA